MSLPSRYAGFDMAQTLWSVMVTKSSPATRAASATSPNVPPPSDATVCTWTAPTHSSGPRADGASKGRRVDTEAITTATINNKPAATAVLNRRFTNAI
jgi:hypothetical protein